MRPLYAGLAVAICGGPALAQAPTTRVLDCTSGGCHTKQLDHAFLHGPTAVKACDACHEYKDPVGHSFTLKRQGKDLCLFCHIDKAGTEGPVVHAPVSKGDCTACHDAHGSGTRQMLKAATVPSLCAQCHTDVMTGSHAHKPAATDCMSCHKAHTADHAKLLTMPSRELCLSCHQDVGKALGAAHPHLPAKEDCLQCHSPHATDHHAVLKSAPADLCISCHQEVGKHVSSAAHPHSAVAQGKACLNCHTAHGSDNAKQLTGDTISTCLACHAQPIKVSKDRVIAAVAELADPKQVRHGPVASGDCAGCHGVHGAEHTGLLVKPYPKGFYQPFTDDAYALCFNCHDRNLAASRSAERETGFRDGTRNLHFLHVANSVQGRSCRACHSVHASKHSRLIADTVSFGQWKLPINFTPTAEGGSCAPGCHKPASYTRQPAAMPVAIPGGSGK